jgi:LacI family transcriptional regulator
MVTIKDVAKESGFSPSTISVVLNNAALARYIPAKTKGLIRLAAQRLDYHPNQFARSLRSQRSRTVGVMVSDITDPYCAQILRGIESSLFRHGYLPLLTDIQNNRFRFARYVQMLLERRVEGLVTIANSLLLKTDLLYPFKQRNVPTVIIGRESGQDAVSSVVIDNEAGTRTGLEHLYRLGHRKIAFIKGPKTVVDSSLRWEGIANFAQEAGLRLGLQLVVELKRPSSSYEEAHRAADQLLKRRRPFTALMAFDDVTAFGAIRALERAGIKVPEDCSVLGFDDVAASAFYNPPLTTIRQPMESLGSTGVEILLEAISASLKKKAFAPTHRKVKPQLVVRESTAAWAAG